MAQEYRQEYRSKWPGCKWSHWRPFDKSYQLYNGYRYEFRKAVAIDVENNIPNRGSGLYIPVTWAVQHQPVWYLNDPGATYRKI